MELVVVMREDSGLKVAQVPPSKWSTVSEITYRPSPLLGKDPVGTIK